MAFHPYLYFNGSCREAFTRYQEIFGGELVLIGWPARDLTSTELRAFFFHGIKTINSRVRTPQTWRRAIALVSSGAVDLRPMVTHRYDIDHGIEAFELLRARKGMKALIIPNQSAY